MTEEMAKRLIEARENQDGTDKQSVCAGYLQEAQKHFPNTSALLNSIYRLQSTTFLGWQWVALNKGSKRSS